MACFFVGTSSCLINLMIEVFFHFLILNLFLCCLLEDEVNPSRIHFYYARCYMFPLSSWSFKTPLRKRKLE